MKKAKLVALVCAFLSGVSGFTSGMQGESSQKNEKDLKNGASIKDENQKSIKQMINSGLNNPNLKRYGKKTLKYGGGTLGTWGFLKYVGNSILFLGSHPIAKFFGVASEGSNDIKIRVPLGYDTGENFTPGVEEKLNYYNLSGSLKYTDDNGNEINFRYDWASPGGDFQYWSKNSYLSVYTNWDTVRGVLKNCKEIVICFGGNGDNAIVAKPSNVKNKLVLAIDLPGYGFSEQKWKNDKILQNYAYQCLQLAKSFSDILNGKEIPVTVSGWSLGGYAASYLTKFEDVKKCILYAPIVLSKVNPFVHLVRPVVFGYDLDSIENLKNSHKGCKIFLASGTLDSGDFLSLEQTVLGKSVQEVTKQQPNNKQGKFKNEDLQATAKAVRKAILDSRNKDQSENGLENRLFVRLVDEHHCPYEGKICILNRFLSDNEKDFVKPDDQ